MTWLMKMLRLTTVLGSLVLGACSSLPEYRAASGNGYGYAEQQISTNFYRVTFTAAGNDADKARAYALRRAAELTAEQGYDWFAVADKETLTERDTDNSLQFGAAYQQHTVQDCGLLGCRSRTVTQPQYQAATNLPRRQQVTSMLDIRLGKGVMPEGDNVYPAGQQ